MDKINKNFLCGKTAQKRKIHLLSWQIVMKPKRLGGLGIKQSLHMNKALLSKRLCHIRTNPNELHGPLNKNKHTLKICDTWDMQKNWSFDVVSFVLPTKIIGTIRATPRPFLFDQNDLPT